MNQVPDHGAEQPTPGATRDSPGQLAEFPLAVRGGQGVRRLARDCGRGAGQPGTTGLWCGIALGCGQVEDCAADEMRGYCAGQPGVRGLRCGSARDAAVFFLRPRGRGSPVAPSERRIPPSTRAALSPGQRLHL